MKFTSAVVGLGRVGWRWEVEDPLRPKPCTHVGAYDRHRGIDLIAVCDIDRSILDRFSQYYPDVRTYRSHMDLIKNEDVDIVSVATPASTHYSIVLDLVRHSGVRVVFCEKPLATTVGECLEMVGAAEEAGASLAVNHTRRWWGLWRGVEKMVKHGELGEPLVFVGKFSGDWFETGVHMSDLYNWLCPGAVDYVAWRRLPYLLFDVEIYFRYGCMAVRGDMPNVEVAEVARSERYSGYDELLVKRVVPVNSVDYITPMFRAVDNIVQHLSSGVPVLCTGVDGMRAVEKCLEWGERYGWKVR